MMRLPLLPLVLLVLGSAPACTGTLPPPGAPSTARSLVRDELFFGMRKLDGSLVTEAEWQAFVDSVVPPRFPDGLTVLAGYGQYQPITGPLVREPSKVLILIHPGTPNADRRIREIAADYCRRFQQESVMWVTERILVEFVTAAVGGIDRPEDL